MYTWIKLCLFFLFNFWGEKSRLFWSFEDSSKEELRCKSDRERHERENECIHVSSLTHHTLCVVIQEDQKSGRDGVGEKMRKGRKKEIESYHGDHQRRRSDTRGWVFPYIVDFVMCTHIVEEPIPRPENTCCRHHFDGSTLNEFKKKTVFKT